MNKITDKDLANRGVKGLPDVPGLTTEEMQRKLEEIAREILVPKVNEIIDNLIAVNSNLDYKFGARNGSITVDLNTLFDIGFFYTYDALNKPTVVDGFLEVLTYNDVTVQRFQPYMKSTIYTRMYAGGKWSAWDSTALDSDLVPTQSSFSVTFDENNTCVINLQKNPKLATLEYTIECYQYKLRLYYSGNSVFIQGENCAGITCNIALYIWY